jgi:hypothetical protein
MTVQLWGEHPIGEWKLEIISKDGSQGLIPLYLFLTSKFIFKQFIYEY